MNVEIAGVAARNFVQMRVLATVRMLVVLQIYHHVNFLSADREAEPVMVFVHLLQPLVDVVVDHAEEDHVRTNVAVAHYEDHDFAMTMVWVVKDALHLLHHQHRVVIPHVAYAIVANVREAYVVDAYPKEPLM